MTATTEQPVTEAPLRLVLAGRAFRDAGRTLAAVQDVWVTPHLNKAGLYDYLKGKMRLGENQDPAEFFEQMTMRIAESGRLFHIAAGLMEEDGKDIPEDPDDFAAFMQERVQFLATLRAPEDRATLTRYLTQLVLRFFASGLASLKTFLTSSAGEPDGPFGAAKSSDASMSSAPA